MNVWSSAKGRFILDYHLEYVGIYLRVIPHSHHSHHRTVCPKVWENALCRAENTGPLSCGNPHSWRQRASLTGVGGACSKGRTSHHSDWSYIKHRGTLAKLTAHTAAHISGHLAWLLRNVSASTSQPSYLTLKTKHHISDAAWGLPAQLLTSVVCLAERQRQRVSSTRQFEQTEVGWGEDGAHHFCVTANVCQIKPNWSFEELQTFGDDKHKWIKIQLRMNSVELISIWPSPTPCLL